jgi:wyosine [tRNA(Phe)-imidazoG37] synthetase (radical SAM superfamily)
MTFAMVSIWRKTDRPHRSLQLNAILDGMLEFREKYQGELVTETMLIGEVLSSPTTMGGSSM